MIKTFKIISLLEGLSYLLLLFVAVPIKYIGNNDVFVKALGMPHGMLFLAYIVGVFLVCSQPKWNKKIIFYALLASILPFGTFYINKKYVNDTE